MIALHPSRNTASRAALCGAETCAMVVGRSHFRYPHCQDLDVPARINEQRTHGSSVQQQVAVVSLGTEYDSFIHLAAIFYNAKLDEHISAFQTDGVLSLLLQLAGPSRPAMALAAGAAGRLPAHFRSRLWGDAHNEQPRHGRRARPPQLPASCGFTGVFQHLGRSCVP